VEIATIPEFWTAPSYSYADTKFNYVFVFSAIAMGTTIPFPWTSIYSLDRRITDSKTAIIYSDSKIQDSRAHELPVQNSGIVAILEDNRMARD